MPIMTRMRDNMPVILFGLLIAFLITIIFEWGMDYLGIRGGRHDTIGVVDGKKISYQEFAEVLKNVTDARKNQGNADMTDEQLKAARQQVWETLVTQDLVDEQIKRLGISVTDQELVDWVRGENPP
jgi:peptidyl-prolyl cis-trans isomerase D